MSKLLKYITACILVALASAAASHAHSAELAGTWATVPTEAAAGSDLYVFRHHNGAWSGFYRSEFGDVQLRNIAVNGKSLSFDAFLDLGLAPTPPPPIKIRGFIVRDQIRLVVPAIGGEARIRILRRANSGEKGQNGDTPAPSSASSLSPLPYNGLAQTPPMGWNSWNKFQLKADDSVIRQIADAIVKTGLREAGYVYVNIDDGWQGQRDAVGVIHSNERYPDMKALGQYIHSLGLNFGIYSSPGPKTCGGFEGSYQHEEQDAKTYAQWGVDYLKYDWCSAASLYDTPAEMQAAYLKMGTALRGTGRPIVYALCQYGLFDVGQWGRAVGANLWRTTFDIWDRWRELERIGFNQDGNVDYAGPGGWNDPDMLEIGNGGMTLEEYRTHFTLWSMLSAPLLLGNDVKNMSDDTRALLLNKDVIAIDQDALGKQAVRVSRQGKLDILSKPLEGGDVAVAFFNHATTPETIGVLWSDIGVAGVSAVRDLWSQKDLDEPMFRQRYQSVVPPHGTVLLRVKIDGRPS